MNEKQFERYIAIQERNLQSSEDNRQETEKLRRAIITGNITKLVVIILFIVTAGYYVSKFDMLTLALRMLSG